MTKTAAEQLIERETQVTCGSTPRQLLDRPLGEMNWQLRGDEFLLRASGEHYFHYRRGSGVTVERGEGAETAEEGLWLNGSVYAAIASINGFLPIHASAVAAKGAVYAFSARTGGGKSTLVAALGNLGLPMFCDDTLVLDVSDPDCIECLPGHKRLKLTPEAIDLAGAVAEERVSPAVDKSYARPAAGVVGFTLPLAELIFLEEGPEPSVRRLPAAERLIRIQDDHYTAQLFAAARQLGRREMFHHSASLARQIRMAEFVRPMDKSRFEDSVAIVAEYVTGTRAS